MNFNEKLILIMDKLNLTNATLAKYANIDPSLISRLKSGVRTPSKNSDQIKHISKGIEKYIKDNKLETVLKSFLKKENTIIDYLQNNTELKNERKVREVKCSKDDIVRLKTFTKKLNTFMTELNISNIKLSKSLNIDASLVSRYKNGERIPSSKNKIITDLCNFLITLDLNKISDILNISNNDISKSEIKEQLLNYFYEEIEDIDSTSIDSFLKNLDESSFEVNLALSMSPDLLKGTSGKKKESEIYYGEDGLRASVLRILTNIAKDSKSRELCFFSDEPIEWLTKDKNFTKKWAMLMFYILNKKNTMKIIHNVNRNLDEILLELENWLPFYMTGKVTPYYFKENNDNHFSNTIFIAPELCSMYSSHVTGIKNNIPYFYNNEKNEIKCFEDQFNKLLTYCNPILKQYTLSNINEFNKDLRDFGYVDGKSKSLINNLPLYTMNHSLFEKILEKNNLTVEEKNILNSYYQTQVNIFNEQIVNNKKTDYCNVSKLKENKVSLDIPNIIFNKKVYYDQNDLIEHIKLIEILNKKYSNYSFKSIKNNSLNNINICFKENAGVFITKSDGNPIALKITHNILCASIESYINRKR